MVIPAEPRLHQAPTSGRLQRRGSQRARPRGPRGSPAPHLAGTTHCLRRRPVTLRQPFVAYRNPGAKHAGLFQETTAVVPSAVKAASTGRVRGPLPHALHIAPQPGGVRVARSPAATATPLWLGACVMTDGVCSRATRYGRQTTGCCDAQPGFSKPPGPRRRVVSRNDRRRTAGSESGVDGPRPRPSAARTPCRASARLSTGVP